MVTFDKELTQDFQTTFQVIELVILTPTFVLIFYLVVYYLLMGYNFVKILKTEFDVKWRSFWLFFGGMSIMNLMTWAHTIQMYFVVPLAQLSNVEVCSN